MEDKYECLKQILLNFLKINNFKSINFTVEIGPYYYQINIINNFKKGLYRNMGRLAFFNSDFSNFEFRTLYKFSRNGKITEVGEWR